MIKQICKFYGFLTTCKKQKQFYSATHSWDETNLLFGISLGTPGYTWLHIPELTE